MISQILILSALGCIAFANARSVPEVTCNASPEVVQRGKTATITCHFPFDISHMTSVLVSVGLLPDNEPEREDELELVQCIKHNTPKPECKVLEEGYSIDSKVDTNLKLHISNISAQHSGRFICQMLHGGEDRGERETPKPKTCSLSVRRAVNCKASPEQVKIGDNATVTCNFPDDVSQMSSVAVTVGHFPDSEPGRKYAVSLVECTKNNKLQLECMVSKGYVIEGSVKTTLKLRVPNISAQHFGRFLCRMFPAEGEEIPISENCSLSILGSDVEEETNSALIIAPVIVVVLVVVAVTAVIFVLYKKGLLKRFQANAGQKDSKGSPRHQGRSTFEMTVDRETVCDPLLSKTKPVHPPHGDIPTTGEAEALQTSTAAGSEENTLRLLLVGGNGTGKRATGNTILGRECFKTDEKYVRSDCERHVTKRYNTRIEIMDSPGLFTEMKNQEEICTTIIQSVAGMHPGPHAILYVTKEGRNLEKKRSAYTRLKHIFDNDVTKYIIIVFTHGGMQKKISSSNVPDKLKPVLEECGNRYILFNSNSHDKQTQVDELLRMVEKMTAANGRRPYACPKYSMIGERLEGEVRKHMDKYEERQLQTNKYLQDIKALVEGLRSQVEFKRKKAQREEEARKVQERVKKLEQDQENQQAVRGDNIQRLRESMDVLKQHKDWLIEQYAELKKKDATMQRSTWDQQLEDIKSNKRQIKGKVEQQRSDDEDRKEAEREELKRQKQEKMKLQEQHEQQLQQDIEEMNIRNTEVEELMAREREVQRERECRTEMERQREMEELKNRVAERKEPDFLEAAMDDVKSIVTALPKAK